MSFNERLEVVEVSIAAIFLNLFARLIYKYRRIPFDAILVAKVYRRRSAHKT